jgi:hypothetical protein
MQQAKGESVMTENKTTRCANKDCTCHTQGTLYCSEGCREAAQSGATGCHCGHAGCTARAYLRTRSSETAMRSAARHSH